MYRSSPFRSTLNTGYITALDMCAVCTGAVLSVAPWTRVTSQLWTSVKYEPPSDTFVHISTTLTRFYVSRTILRLHFRGAWFGNSTTFPRLYLWHPANSTTLTRAPNQPGAKNNQSCWANSWRGQQKLPETIAHVVFGLQLIDLRSMETGPLEDVFPCEHGGYSIAVLV